MLEGFARPRAYMQITNLRTNLTFEAIFNPTELQEQLAANYNEVAILGLSHQPTQYTGTGNHSFDLELLFALPTIREDKSDTIRTDLDELDYRRKLLLAACYPQGGDHVRGGAPDRHHFFWPGLVDMTCTIRAISTTFQQFNIEGRPVRWTTKLKLVEIRDARITSEDVLTWGTQRPPGTPSRSTSQNVIDMKTVEIVSTTNVINLKTVEIVSTGNAKVASGPFVPRKGPKPTPPVYKIPQQVISADSTGQGLAPGSVTTLSEQVIGPGVD